MNPEVTYSIPLDAGFVWVITCMDVFIAGVGGGAIQVNDSNKATFWYVAVPSDSTGDWEPWRGNQAFVGPDFIEATATVFDPLGHADLRISGYQLTLP